MSSSISGKASMSLRKTAKNTYEKASVGTGTTLSSAQTTGWQTRQKGGELFKGYTGCDVQGFKTFASDYAPQTLVVTATVFSYYCYDLVRNRGWINSIAAIVAFIGAYAGQIAVIDFQNVGHRRLQRQGRVCGCRWTPCAL
jgi:hypothetical protein